MLNVEVPEQHRWRIVDALGYMGDDAVATALIALLEKNSWAAKGDGWQWEGFAAGVPTYPDCRHRIVTVLGQIDAKKAAPRLLELLKEKGSGKANWGYEIMPLLAKWGYKEAIPELKAVLASKEEDAPVFSAAVCLLELKDRTGMPLLEAELKNPAGAHESVCQVLAQFGSGLDQNLVPLLVGLLDDNANDELVMVRSVAACRALAKITGIQLRPGQTEAGLEDVPLWKAWYEKNKKSKGK
ncbi:MAG TPA: hypothetical protein VE988_09835 [Gemmataceae bacterium]|nr:hypothetical protein [Gemmataceae bacterium]